ncbi:MAG TPA: hypothetical protein DCY88_05065 [Cyanobacteria bacterium UBA11372]|nr:hypothetical protein [Cyanobacteria bacterium UBA11372]
MENQSKKITISFGSSKEIFAQLQALFQSGELSKVLGVNILDISAVSEPQPETSVIEPVKQLAQWLENVFEEGLLTLEQFLNTQKLAEVRKQKPPGWLENLQLGKINPETIENEVCRVIPVHLPPEELLGLIVTIKPEETDGLTVLLQVLPQQAFLPANLQLRVLDEEGEVILDESDKPLEQKAGAESNLIQLQFSVPPQEQFRVQLALDSQSITQDFNT